MPEGTNRNQTPIETTEDLWSDESDCELGESGAGNGPDSNTSDGDTELHARGREPSADEPGEAYRSPFSCQETPA